MRKKGSKTTKFKDLRKRAEKLKDKSPSIGQNATKSDLQGLIQELHTHQIELELQNLSIQNSSGSFVQHG